MMVNSDKNNNDDDQLVFNGFAMVKKKKTKQQQQQQPRLLGGDSSVAPTTGTQRVPQLTIDMFQISHLSILALDTQDYETLVLQGAMQTLTNIATRPYVVALEDANVQRPATKFMQDFLPDYQFVQRMDCLTYFALVDVVDDVKQVLAECDSEIA
jgi:Methyltransferase FkbM domain